MWWGMRWGMRGLSKANNSSGEQWIVWIYFKSRIEKTKGDLIGWELGK
jgi:hypothetical protein